MHTKLGTSHLRNLICKIECVIEVAVFIMPFLYLKYLTSAFFYSTELLHDRKGQEQNILESTKD